MNRETEVKEKFFDFLIMLQLSFTFRLPECSRPIIATFPCILFCVVVFLSIESFLFCVQLWCCGMCQATVSRRFVSISAIVSSLSMYSIASSAFFIFCHGEHAWLLRCLRREQKNHDRATKSSPPGAQRQSKDDRSIEKMLLSSFLYRRMRICKFRHNIGAITSGACPNNAPAKPTRPHHRKLVPDPLDVDPVYVWAYHPLLVRL